MSENAITFRHNDGTTETHRFNTADLSDFDIVLEKIIDDNIRSYTKTWLRLAPEYVFTVAASSSGKYHPASDLGNGGLKRHLISVAKMLIYLTEPESQKERFSQNEIDIMICASLIHDILKSGWQEDYEKDKNTRFDHPRLLANAIRCQNDIETNLSRNDIELIADCVATHMGEWTTSKYHSGAPLDKPMTEMQKTVHLADYLASRRDLSFVIDETVYALDTQAVKTIKQMTNVSSQDIATINKAMLNDIDMAAANTLGIKRTADEVRSVWNTIVKTRSASTKQLKYIELAKVMCK